MDRPEKAATPAETATAEPPVERPAARVGPDGQADRRTVVTGLDVAGGVLDGHRHRRGHRGSGDRGARALTRKARCVGVPGVMSKADEVAGVYNNPLEATRV